MAIYALADADLEVEDETAFWVAPSAILIRAHRVEEERLGLVRGGAARRQ